MPYRPIAQLTEKQREVVRARERARYRKSAARRKTQTERSRRWREKNRERLRAHRRKTYHENLERSREYARQHYRKNKEKVIAITVACFIRRKYGLTKEQYAALGNVCEICGVVGGITAKNGRRLRLHVDHCHDTKKVRGLLCHHCNTAIGHLKHDVALLQKAMAYLQRE